MASQPSNGSINTVHYIFHGQAAGHIGDPGRRQRGERVDWVPLSEVGGLIAKGEIVSGPTLIGLLMTAAHLA